MKTINTGDFYSPAWSRWQPFEHEGREGTQRSQNDLKNYSQRERYLKRVL